MRLIPSCVFAGLALLLLGGCGGDTPTKPKAPAALTANDTPGHAIDHLQQAYVQERADEFVRVLTKGYHFQFSDTQLAGLYPSGWIKSDEYGSANHLFHGFLAPDDVQMPAATSIDLHFSNTLIEDDSSSGGDPATHKLAITRLDGTFEIKRPGDQYPTEFPVFDDIYNLYLVRGDAADSLDSNQAADSTHWYVSRWDDVTYQVVGNAAMRSPHSTWAWIRAMYR